MYAGSWMNLGWSVTSGGTKTSELHTNATRHAGILHRRRARPSQIWAARPHCRECRRGSAGV